MKSAKPATAVLISAVLSLAACGPAGHTAPSGGQAQSADEKFYHTPLRCDASPTPDELLASRAPKAAKRYKLTFLQVSLAGYVYQAYAYGATQAARDAGVDLTIVAGKGYASPEAQLKDAENVLQRGTEGLILAPVDYKGSVPIVQKAKAAGVPVVNTSTEVDSPDVYSVMQDDYEQGRIAADEVAKLIPNGGTGIVMGGPANATWSRKRVAGFQDQIAQRHPKVKIAQVTNQLVDPAEGAQRFQNAIQAHPKIDFIYSVFVFVLPPDSIPPDYRSVPHVTSGYEPIVQAGLRSGALTSSISVDQYAMGYDSVSRLVDVLNGNKPPKVTCLPQPVFRKTDLTGNPYAARELYPPSFKAQAG